MHYRAVALRLPSIGFRSFRCGGNQLAHAGRFAGNFHFSDARREVHTTRGCSACVDLCGATRDILRGVPAAPPHAGGADPHAVTAPRFGVFVGSTAHSLHMRSVRSCLRVVCACAFVSCACSCMLVSVELHVRMHTHAHRRTHTHTLARTHSLVGGRAGWWAGRRAGQAGERTVWALLCVRVCCLFVCFVCLWKVFRTSPPVGNVVFEPSQTSLHEACIEVN